MTVKISYTIANPDNNNQIFLFFDNQYYIYDLGLGRIIDPRFASDLWKGLPAGKNIDSALNHPTDKNKVYLFLGSAYYLYLWKEQKIEDGYPKPITDLWSNFPANGVVNAALNHPHNSNKVYVFSGTAYYRCSWDEGKVDSGYPYTTSTYWYGLPDNITIDASLVDPTDGNKVYLFSGDQYYLYLWSPDAVDAGYPKSTQTDWYDNYNPAPVYKPEETVSAALQHPENLSALLFSGKQYYAYDFDLGRTTVFLPSSDLWKGLPQNVTIDVTLNDPTDKNKVYLFSGNQYYLYLWKEQKIEEAYPKPITNLWSNMPSNVTISAALNHPYNSNKVYVFAGNQYYRCSWQEGTVDSGYPNITSRYWPGLPADKIIDAALTHSGDKNKIYFFVGDQYYLYLWSPDAVDSGYPKPIQIDWYDRYNPTSTVMSAAEKTLIDATLQEIDFIDNLMKDAKIKIFNLNADGTAKSDGSSLTSIDWNPTHDACLLKSTPGANSPLFYTNAVPSAGYTIYKRAIGIIGEKGPGRYIVLGGNPFSCYYSWPDLLNPQMHQFIENAFSWLTGRDDLKTKPFKVVIAHMDNSYYFRGESGVRKWLDQYYTGQVSYNAERACDGDALSASLTSDTDLLIISQYTSTETDNTAVAQAVNQALQQGIPVLYVHHDGNEKPLGRALFSNVFDVHYDFDNYWYKLCVKDYDASAYMNTLSDDIRNIETLFKHFQNEDFNFDWSNCDDKGNNVPGLQQEFLSGAEAAQTIVNSLDSEKKDIFAVDDNKYRFYRLLIQTADAFRKSVTYPMDKVITNDTKFMKSYYADHVVYNYRLSNPAQPDMGNFSRSNFSHITPINKTIAMESKEYFRSTGLYALPGQTVEITRNDSSKVATKIFINTLRSGATHAFENYGYKRPKFLQSVAITIQSNETIKLTSPYGGPIQVQFDTNDLPVSFTFKHVGEHPYWRSEADNLSFEQKLNAGEYDWAEVATPGFEIHSTLGKMRESMNDTKWGSAEKLAAATMRYMHNFPHVLAGFQGPGIDIIPELHDFAKANGWTMETLDMVKHMNADQATCGYGCSGNPYDAYWAYSPTGHGDLHELGHGLQGGWRFKGWANHTMTNYYSYYSKSNYYRDTGNDPDCQELPFRKMFDVLQASVKQSNPKSYINANLWNDMGWSEGAGMFVQMMMAVQAQGTLKDGWLLRARLHMLEREYDHAKGNDTSWNAKRTNLGFTQYTSAEARDIDVNDWYLIALSYVSGRNFTEYFDMWAIAYSNKAKLQADALNYPMMPKLYFKCESTDYCKSLDKPGVPVDGNQTW